MMELFAHLYKELTHALKGVKQVHLVVNILCIVFEHFFRALKGETLLFYKVKDCAHTIDVFFGELTIAFTVLFWLDEIKLGFPKANKGWSYTKHLGYFTD